MPTDSSAQSFEAPAKITECRALLRYFRTPDRLRYNSLASAIMAAATSAAERGLFLEAVIEAALSHLGPRERVIVQRCGIEREPFSDVARDLGISERHLYREHHRILSCLVRIIDEAPRPMLHAKLKISSCVDEEIRTSRNLEENGADVAAASMIERLIKELPEETAKCRLLLRLAELHARSGRFTLSRDLVDTVIGRLAESDDVLRAECYVTRAYVFDECGQGETVVTHSALDAARILRKASTYRFDEHSARTLTMALILAGMSYAKSGKFDRLAGSTAEVSQILPLIRRPDEDLLMAIFALTAHYECLCNFDIDAASGAFTKAANVARGAGFTLSSIVNLINNVNVRRSSEQSLADLRTITHLYEVARDLGNENVLLLALVELANLHVTFGDTEKAQQALIEASTLHVENASLRAAMLRTCAKVAISLKEFEVGLGYARTAESMFAAQGKSRLVGTPLRLQAEALLGLGDRKAAYRAISGAIDALSSRSGSQVLRQAYGVLNRIRNSRPLPPAITKKTLP